MVWFENWVRDAFHSLFPSTTAKRFYSPMNPAQREGRTSREGEIVVEYSCVYTLVNNRLTKVPVAIAAPKICLGCTFYHGKIYSGDRLHCSIHPAGNGADCKDFDAKHQHMEDCGDGD